MGGEEKRRGGGIPKMGDDGRKNKVLVFSTRGVTARYRHLMDDVRQLLPHAKKEPKMDTKERLNTANEICELRGCNWCVLFEVRKRQDLYIWMSSVPSGPSVKFHVTNVHTMAELKFTGNNILHSRPLITFDHRFDSTPHFRLLKEMLTSIFVAPKGHRKTKPFVDHIISFMILDNRIWVRHYQIIEATEGMKPNQAEKSPSSELVEIGPRFVMNPVRIFNGSLCGATIYENPAFVSPNMVRRMLRKRHASDYEGKVVARDRAKRRKQSLRTGENPINNIFREEPEDDDDDQEGTA